jgi:hypothetical protein
MASKRCTKCGVERPLEDFPRDSHRKDGHCSRCKACERERNRFYTLRNEVHVAAGNVPHLKRCIVCNMEKPLAQYTLSRRMPDGHASQCRECRRLSAELTKDARRDAYLQRTYGITQATYDVMLREQGDCCKICGSVEPGRRSCHFHVDHDHVTGRIRGLLCDQCNTGIGKFRDSAMLLRCAATYCEGPFAGLVTA